MKSYLKESHPHLWKEIDLEKNVDIKDYNKITTANPKPIWWICEKGHSWIKPPSDRTRTRISKATGKEVKGASCPICANKKVLPGYNDLATTNPKLAKEFHPTKNKDLTINTIPKGYSKKIWWICEIGHEWEASPYVRDRTGSRCLTCINQKVVKGFNDLETTNPYIASQWHPVKNGEKKPDSVTSGADQKVWWLGICGHEWDAKISSRASTNSRNRGCPICSNKKIIEGINDLITTHPELVKEIHIDQQPPASTLHAGSSDRILWQCPNNQKHTWETSVSKRAQAGQGCPACSNKTSKPEEDLYFFLRSILGDDEEILLNTRKILPSGKELDIYIPRLNFAIEYNGLYWHSENKVGRKRHYEKWKEAKEEKIQLFTLWEDYWLENEKLIKRMLLVKLGLRDSNGMIYARKTNIQKVPSSLAKPFLIANHLQGYRSSSFFYGLFDEEDNLVSILGIKEDKKTHNLEITRFASSKQVKGGFTKLLTKVIKDYPLTKEILSYSDNSISNGELYRRTDFEEVTDNTKSYFYAINQKRYHRSHYTKARYKNDPNLLFIEGMTETELANLNKLSRVWDAGNTRWVKHLDR